ncbi:hypothetical protein HMPREF1016_03037 [Bacteroides eggerthii 1_2_48FAA]|uniref:Uncharacterized protein n=1 Tax=Bacteroides eggerthii 1_2_48FAA TaxID=665953 RepID=E5X2F9_9BACE|nr:hypothetical protein HMPREF1016_03037 [Bacteroides eggerthii 1_2_48FAA]
MGSDRIDIAHAVSYNIREFLVDDVLSYLYHIILTNSKMQELKPQYLKGVNQIDSDRMY